MSRFRKVAASCPLDETVLSQPSDKPNSHCIDLVRYSAALPLLQACIFNREFKEGELNERAQRQAELEAYDPALEEEAEGVNGADGLEDEEEY